MTARAIVVGFIALATFFAAINVQVGWLYALADAFLGFLLASLVLGIWSVRNLEVTTLAEALVEQGRPLRLTVAIENKGLVARGFLAVLVPPVGRLRRGLGPKVRMVPHGWPFELLVALGPGEIARVNLEAPTPRRGVFPAPPVAIQAAPLGLFFWRRTLRTPGQVVVTPRILPLDGLPWFRPHSRGGEEHPMARTVPHGEMIRSTRDYRSGDPVRTIHWRGTARVGRLVVKETEGTAIAGGATVVLDLAGHTEDSLEHAIVIAASLLAHLHGEGVAARLISQEGEVSGGLEAQLEALAHAGARAESLATRLQDVEPGGLIVVSPRDAGWRSLTSTWIQAGPPDQISGPGAIPCPQGSDVPATLLRGRPA